MKKRIKLKPKHREFGKNLVKHEGNATRAYMETYPEAQYRSAGKCANRLLQTHPQILAEVRHELDKRGITYSMLAKKLKEKLESKKVIEICGQVKEVPDHNAQLKAVDLSLKAHGVYSEGNTDNSVNINFQQNQQIIFEKLDERLKEVAKIFNALKPAPIADSVRSNSAEEIDADYKIET